MNRADNHECLVLPCHVQMGEDSYTGDKLIKQIYDISFNDKI